MSTGLCQARIRAARRVILGLLALGLATTAPAQTPPTPAPDGREAELEDRVQRLEALNRRVLEQYETLSRKYEALERRLGKESESPSSPASDPAPAPAPVPSLPSPTPPVPSQEIWTAPEPLPPSTAGPSPKASRFYADYDEGFVIAPRDEEKTPFLLRVNGRMEFRHTGFARDDSSWWNSAGDRIEIRNRNDFEIERGRLLFSGFFIEPKLHYFLQIDFDTDDNHDLDALDYWVNYQFNKAFDLHFGKAYVPGSRSWLAGAWRQQFADRSLATTFFRPDRSVGIWAQGELVENVQYRAMVSNGYNTSDLTFENIDLNFAGSGTIWWDVFGDYGQGYPDLQWHETPGAQVGTSFTGARSTGRGPVDQPTLEQNFVRLSDGTRLTLPDALAPGLTVNSFDIYLWAIDAAFKYRGFSVSGEYYLRWLQNINGFGAPLPYTAMFDHGFHAECGYFLVPKRLEVMARTSQIWGPFGTGSEYAGGLNWYINGTHAWKFTLDATRVIGSPAQNAGPNYQAGDTGVLIRSQLITTY